MTAAMGEKRDPKSAPRGSGSDRSARLKSALKANLAKRKAQARERSATVDRADGTQTTRPDGTR